VGKLVAFSSFSERRRSREIRRLHEACRAILAASIAAERMAAAMLPPEARAVHVRRLRIFEDAEAYAATTG
jgi:hypothetical protein